MSPCPGCGGSGEVDDPLMSVALGAVIGCGWLPSKQTCRACGGSGLDNRAAVCDDEKHEAA